MSLMETVNKAIAEAMKARDQDRLGPLRMLKAAMMNREVEKGGPLGDTEELQVVRTLIKQRRDSIEQFTKGGRMDLADKETAEIAVLEAYLPAAMSLGELQRLVADAVAETGATSAKDLGKVMKAVMAKAGSAGVDGKVVNEMVRKALA